VIGGCAARGGEFSEIYQANGSTITLEKTDDSRSKDMLYNIEVFPD
jgi:hypothetical protein